MPATPTVPYSQKAPSGWFAGQSRFVESRRAKSKKLHAAAKFKTQFTDVLIPLAMPRTSTEWISAFMTQGMGARPTPKVNKYVHMLTIDSNPLLCLGEKEAPNKNKEMHVPTIDPRSSGRRPHLSMSPMPTKVPRSWLEAMGADQQTADKSFASKVSRVAPSAACRPEPNNSILDPSTPCVSEVPQATPFDWDICTMEEE